MKKIASFIVRKKIFILILMLLLTVTCGILIPKVNINTDMTKYLPDNSSMKKGMDIMEDEFSQVEETYTIRAMFEGLSSNQKSKIKDKLEAVPNVDSVTYEADDSDYNKDNYTLYVISTKYGYDTPEEAGIEEYISENFTDYDVTVSNDDTSSPDIPPLVVAMALVIMLIILFIACGSYIEPVLFLVTIGMAIVINLGTNIILGEISDITMGISAILQLVLSMDYSIILMNRFRQELQKNGNKNEAMTSALTAAVSSITSSSVTTIVGLIMLVFMSFKIGADLGIVLAKGVFCSLICVFTVLPGLILIFHKLILKTTKKTRSHKERRSVLQIMGNFSYKYRGRIALAFALLFIGSYFLQTSTKIAYTLTDEDPIADIFPPTNQIVVLYNNKDEGKIGSLADKLEKNKNVKSVSAFSTTLGKQYTAEKLKDMISDMGGDIDISADMLKIIYYDYYMHGETKPITVSDFIHFIADDVVKNEMFSKYMDKDIEQNIDDMVKFADRDAVTSQMTAEQMADYFGMNAEDIKQLMLYYYTQNGGVDTGSMTLPVFADFIANEVTANEKYSSMLDASALSQINMLKQFTDANEMTTAYSYDKIAELLGMDSESMRQLFVYYYAMSDGYQPSTMTLSDFVSFIQNDIASDPTFSSYFDENTLAQMNQLSAYTDSGMLQKQMTSSELAAALGMDDGMIGQLFSLYFGSSDALTKTMTLSELTGFLVNNVMSNPNFSSYFDEASKEQLTKMNDLVSIAVSDRELSAAELSGILGIDEKMVEQLLALYAGEGSEVTALPLATFTSFLVDNVLQNEAYAPYFDEASRQQIQTLNSLITTAVSGESFTAAQIAPILGLNEELALQIYTMYFGADTTGKTMSMVEFVDYLLNDVVSNEAYAGYFDSNTISQLKQMQTIMSASIAGTSYSNDEMASILGVDGSMTKMLYTYKDSLGNAGGWQLSVQTVINFLINNSGSLNGMIGENELSQLKLLQSIINGSVDGTSYTADQLADLVGMDATQLEQLYLLYISEHGSTDSWRLSPQKFIDFINSDILTNEDFSGQFSESDAENLKAAKTVIDGVASGKAYTAEEMSKMFGGLSDELNSNMMELMYLYYDGINYSDPTWTLSINDMFNYLWNDMLDDPRFADVLDDDIRAEIADTKQELDDGIKQLKGKNHSLMVLSTSLPGESEETSKFMKNLNEDLEKNLDGDYYIIGNSAMVYEMENSFDQELFLITLLTAVSIFIVVAVTFKSFVIPTILVLIVQCGVFITSSVIGLQGLSIYYLALLIVECILMGATIDYGILYTSYYREMREKMGIKDALLAAYRGSIHTILTSGSIMVLVTAIVGRLFGNPTIEQIVGTLSIGCLSAIILILFFLPGTLAVFDKWVINKKE